MPDTMLARMIEDAAREGHDPCPIDLLDWKHGPDTLPLRIIPRPRKK